MEELQERITQKFYQIKPIESSPVIDFAIETAIHDILSYCHIEVEEFPQALDNTAVLIAIDLLNEGGFLLSDEQLSDGSVKSLTEGDFSISRQTEAERMQMMLNSQSFARKYARFLNAYRKIKW